MAAPGLLPVIVQESWAQCENPNCNKWRKLPPGHDVKEDEPWYCYQNPDDRKATCSASEEEYKEAIVINDSIADAEEVEHNRGIRDRLTAGLLASSSGRGSGAGGKGKGGRGRGRGGRGRGKAGAAAAAAQKAPPVDYYGAQRRSGGPNYREETDEEDEEFLVSEEEREEREPVAPAPGSGRSNRRQQSAYSRHYQQLLANQGSWEAAGGLATGGATAPYVPPPAEAWEGLAQHAPELAELACNAADVASSVQYFEASGDHSVPASGAADAVARLAAMLAAAAALVATADTLTEDERRSCCLDAVPGAHKAELAAAAAVAAAGMPFGVPSFHQQQQAAPAAAGWQQAAAPMHTTQPGSALGGFPQASGMQQFMQPQAMQQQPLAMPAQLAGAGWPLPNGQQAQQQQVLQQPAMQFAAVQPGQQWQQQQQQQPQQFQPQQQQPQQWQQQQPWQQLQQQQQHFAGGQPFVLPGQQAVFAGAPQQQAGGQQLYGLPMQAGAQQAQQQPSIPLIPGVTPDMIARYAQMLQKPQGGQSHANGGAF